MLNSKILLVLISILGSIVVLPRPFDIPNSCSIIVDPITGLQKEICYVDLAHIPPPPDSDSSLPGERPTGPPPKEFRQSLPEENISQFPEESPVTEDIAVVKEHPLVEETPTQSPAKTPYIPELPDKAIPQQPEERPSAQPPAQEPLQPIRTPQIASIPALEPTPIAHPPVKDKNPQIASISELDPTPIAPPPAAVFTTPDRAVRTGRGQCNFIKLDDQTPSSHPRDYPGSVVAIFSQDNCKGCEYINKRVTEICSFYPNVTFIEIDNRYRSGYELFKKHLIVFTPTVIMYHNGERVLRVTGANRDCFEIITQIAQKWYTPRGRRSDVEAAIQGQYQCATSQEISTSCYPDSECSKKLKRLLAKLP